jgi:zinc protease
MTFAIAAPQNISKVEADFKEELARAFKDGFTPSEVDAERSGWLQNQQVRRSDDRTLAQLIASHEQDGRTFSFNQNLEDKVRQLTPDQVLAAMRAVIDPERITIVKAGDFKKVAAAGGGK